MIIRTPTVFWGYHFWYVLFIINVFFGENLYWSFIKNDLHEPCFYGTQPPQKKNIIARLALQDIHKDIGHQRPPRPLRPLRPSRPVLYVLHVLYVLYVLPVPCSTSSTSSTSFPSSASFTSRALRPIRPLRPSRPVLYVLHVLPVPSSTCTLLEKDGNFIS